MFETLIIDIGFKLNFEELEQSFTTYFITFGDLTLNEATSISIELANKAFTHLLITVDITEIAITALNTNPFIYSVNTKL